MSRRGTVTMVVMVVAAVAAVRKVHDERRWRRRQIDTIYNWCDELLIDQRKLCKRLGVRTVLEAGIERDRSRLAGGDPR